VRWPNKLEMFRPAVVRPEVLRNEILYGTELLRQVDKVINGCNE
jgi:hypothetical protein